MTDESKPADQPERPALDHGDPSDTLIVPTPTFRERLLAAQRARASEARATGAKLLAATVMPGPQLTQAGPVCKRVKAILPDLKILWGGYFPTQHADVCLRSGYVDFCIEGQGEAPFRKLVDTMYRGGSL